MLAYGNEWCFTYELGTLQWAFQSHPTGTGARENWSIVFGKDVNVVIPKLVWRNGTDAIDPIFLIARSGRYIWVSYPDQCVFCVEPNIPQIACYPAEDLSDDELLHLLLNQLLPRLVAHQGDLVLHASAVQWAGSAAGLVGAQGAGKSSLAASLCEAGASLMADDGLVIENDAAVLAIPAYPGLRLRYGTPLPHHSEQSGSGTPTFRNKFIFNGEHLPFRFHDEPTPLKALFLLADGTTGEVEIERLAARGAFEAIASNCFRLDAGDRGRMVREFTQITSLVDRLPVYRLSYPRTWSIMPEVIDRIKQVLHCPDPNAND